MDLKSPSAQSDSVRSLTFRFRGRVYAGTLQRRWLGLASILVLALYAAYLGQYVGAVAGGSDESGYMNQARILASGHVQVPARVIAGLPSGAAPDFLYSPLGFKPVAGTRRLVPTYPPGLPLLFILFEPLFGWRYVGDAVLLMHAVAGVVLTYVLGRIFGLGRRWAVLGAAAVAFCPVYVFHSLIAMSDVPALAWTTAAVAAAWRSRERPAWALAAGAALAVDVLVRPTNVLAFIPVAIAVGSSPRRWFRIAIVGLPAAVFLLLYNRSAYGGAFKTGYGETGPEFRLAYVGETLRHYAFWLPILLTPLAILALGIPALLKRTPRTVCLLAAWILAYAALYSAYECTRLTWWYLRFLLPIAPALVVAGLLVARRMAEAIERTASFSVARANLIWVLALALVMVNGAFWNRQLGSLASGRGEEKYSLVADWLAARVPSNSVLCVMQASGALFYSTHYTLVRYDYSLPGVAEKLEKAAQQSGMPIYAVLWPAELVILKEKIPGPWTLVGTIKDVTVWRRGSAPSPR